MEISVDKILDELEIFVQNMRENGDTDLRTILYVFKQIKINKEYILQLNQEQ